MARIYRWFWSHHWPHINDSVTFQVPIRLRTSCTKTRNWNKKWNKTFQKEHKQVNNKRKQQKTPKILQAVSECLLEIGYETTQETCPLKKSLSVTLQEVYVFQTFLLKKSLDREQCLFSSKFGEGTTQTRTMGERYWMCQPPLASVHLHSSPLIFKWKRDYSQSKKKPVDRTISRLLLLCLCTDTMWIHCRYNGMSKGRLHLRISVEKDFFILTRVTGIAQVNI